MLDTLFGKAVPAGAEPPNIALIALFDKRIALNSEDVRAGLREYDPEMSLAEFQSADQPLDSGAFAGRVRWGDHVIDMVGFDAPAPKQVLDLCVPPAHYGQPIKRQAYGHTAHMILAHCGPDKDPKRRYVALAAVAGVLERMGAIVVLNETAHSSLPAGVFSPEAAQTGRMEILRALPLALFYIGFVKYDLPGTSNVWMRTYGARVFQVPGLAMMTPGHAAGQQTMDVFDQILGYMIEQNTIVEAGHTMQVGQENLRFRAPSPSDPQDGSDGPTLVVERIAAAQINQPASAVTARDLTISELTNIRTVAQRAILGYSSVTLGSPPASIVAAIDTEIRRLQKQQSSFFGKLLGRAPKIDANAVASSMGALWGEQIVARFGWRWVHVTRDGKRGFAVASPDGSIAVYPSDHLRRCLAAPGVECAIQSSFQRIASAAVPHLAPEGYFDLLS